MLFYWILKAPQQKKETNDTQLVNLENSKWNMTNKQETYLLGWLFDQIEQ